MYILPGNYNGPFVIPDNIGVRGSSVKGVTLQLLNVTTNTDLITMGLSCRLEDVTIRLTSSLHVNLRSIVMPSTSNVTSALRVIQCFVDNSTASAVGTSDVTAIACIGTGAGLAGFQTARGASFNAASIGNGNKRCILVSNATTFRSRDCNFILTGSTGPTGGTWYSVETSVTGAAFITRSSTISGTGPTGAFKSDVSQTSGTISIGSTNLINSTANSLPLTSTLIPPTFLWSDPGSLPNGTNYMRAGTANSTATEAQIPVAQKCVMFSLVIQARVAPGIGNTCTFTIRKNAVSTILTAILSGTNLTVQNMTTSVDFAMGDKVSLQTIVSAGGSTSDVVATVSMT